MGTMTSSALPSAGLVLLRKIVIHPPSARDQRTVGEVLDLLVEASVPNGPEKDQQGRVSRGGVDGISV